jgi:hypothetical protein
LCRGGRTLDGQMTLVNWVMLVGYVFVLIATTVAVVAGRNDQGTVARRARIRAIGVAILTSVIPVSLFLEEPLGSRGVTGSIVFIGLLALVLLVGLTVFRRGRGFDEWP